MSLLASAPLRPRSTAPDDVRPVLAVVDVNDPLEPVLHRAVAAATTLDAPLRVVVLHPRAGFTTDAAIAARVARRMDGEHRRITAAAAGAVRGMSLNAIEVDLVPYARLPLSARGRARRAAAALCRREAARLVVAVEHLGPLDGGRR